MYIKKCTGFVIKNKQISPKIKELTIIPNEMLAYEVRFRYQTLQALFDYCCYSISKMLDLTSSELIKGYSNKHDSQNLGIEIQKEIDCLWNKACVEYVNLAAAKFIENYYRTTFRIQQDQEDIKNSPPIPGDLFRKLYVDFNNLKQPFTNKILSLIYNDGSNGCIKEKVKKAFDLQIKYLDDLVHLFATKGILHALKNEKIEQYTFICNDNRCPKCKANDGKKFLVSDIQEGINYPLMHPNCRCSIRSHLGKNQETEEDKNLFGRFISSLAKIYNNNIIPVIDYASLALDEPVYNMLAKIFSAYFGKYQTIKVGNKDYGIDKNNFNGIAILPNGEFVVPENATKIDRRLLELMKLRDSLDDTDPRKIDVIKELEELKEMALDNSEEFSVNISKPYSFYELGEDITEQLIDYMESNEKNMHICIIGFHGF